ncbi:MAG: hypothetical protein GY699_23690 [Desulfobacteraceae bacterium]|nr:hypothetical protein [Desulfobacteraceae bacterium]
MIDIGIVHYRIINENEIEAIWYTSRLDQKIVCNGIAKGDTTNGFAERYVVTYFNPDGAERSTFDLEIEKNGAIYDLFWSQNEEVIIVGVGLETSDGLSAGWRQSK